MTEAMLSQDLVRNLAIPPRPEIVNVLFEEMSRDEPDLARVGQKIAADVGLAAAMLKVANSALFGGSGRARSVYQAIDLLGMRNVSSIATGLVIRHSLGGGKNAALERFWDTAEKVAMICAYLAKALRGIPVDEAYTLGLFHDCGIPLLMERFPNYRETLARANRAPDRSFFSVEDEEIGTNHGAVGYFLARSWSLHDDLCNAIRWHHEPDVFRDSEVSETVRNYVGLIHLAQHVQHRQMRSTTDVEWSKFVDVVLGHFALGEEDFINLVDGAQESLLQH
ncbi:MAG: HDOD domain-containing protein [Sterolibacteriaceae bacterium MAG5]|nr:HDOD domain-containing protein [Candidatus Nitricoxidireducens bremensis]